jgi:outer membrane protein TolC
MNLCYTIGINMFSELYHTDTLTTATPTFLLHPIPDISVRSEYSLINKQLELEQQKIKLARADYLPQLGIMAGYNYINGVLLNDEKLFNNGSWMAMFQLNIPLFNGFKGLNKIKSAKTDYKIVQLENEQKFELLKLEMQKAYNAVDEAYFKIQVVENHYEQAKDNFRIVSDRYELGFDSLLTLLEAQTLLLDAESRIIDAKVDYKTAETEYLRTTNQLTQKY